MTERDLNYVQDSAELFYELYEIHLKRLPDPLPGSVVGQPREKADADAATAKPGHLRALTAVIATSAQRAESAGHERPGLVSLFVISAAFGPCAKICPIVLACWLVSVIGSIAYDLSVLLRCAHVWTGGVAPIAGDRGLPSEPAEDHRQDRAGRIVAGMRPTIRAEPSSRAVVIPCERASVRRSRR